MHTWLTILIILITKNALASSAGHGHDSHEIPTVVLYQAINVSIIIVAGIVLGRKKIAEFFSNREQVFVKAQEKAQTALRQAESDYQEMKSRVDKLLMTKDETIAKAKCDANDLRLQMVKDAQLMAQKLQAEAGLSSRVEIERAKFELKERMIKEAFELSKKDLAVKATLADQKKLQDDFISKVQVVQ